MLERQLLKRWSVHGREFLLPRIFLLRIGGDGPNVLLSLGPNDFTRVLGFFKLVTPPFHQLDTLAEPLPAVISTSHSGIVYMV